MVSASYIALGVSQQMQTIIHVPVDETYIMDGFSVLIGNRFLCLFPNVKIPWCKFDDINMMNDMVVQNFFYEWDKNVLR